MSEEEFGMEEEADMEVDDNDPVSSRIRSMTETERFERLYFLEQVWDGMDDSTKWFLSNLGQMFGIVSRNYSRRVGILLSVVFEPKIIRFGTKERLYDPASETYVHETKVSSILFSNLLSWDIIEKREFEVEEEVEERPLSESEAEEDEFL